MITRATLGLIIVSSLLADCGVRENASVPPTTPPLPTAFVAVAPTNVSRIVPSLWRAPVALRQPSPLPLPTPFPRPTQVISSPPPGAPISVQSAGAASEQPGTAMLEALLVVEINRIRAENGLPAYENSPELSAAARAHSCDLAAHNLIAHTSSDGRTLADRLAGANPPWEWPSESIAAGSDDPHAIVAMWMDEPPEGWHRRNILDADQRDVGVGYCYSKDDPTGNHHYWTADFSRRGDA